MVLCYCFRDFLEMFSIEQRNHEGKAFPNSFLSILRELLISD